jgi:predicted dehydrogenase
VQAVAVAVFGSAEDVCNARLVFPSGCVANVTASRLAMKTERKIRIIAEDTYVSIDYAKKTGVMIRRTDNEEKLAEVRAHLEAGQDLSDLDYTDAVIVDMLDVDDSDQLEAQLQDFLESVRGKKAPTVDARAGFAAVRTAERIVSAARDHAERIGIPSFSLRDQSRVQNPY